MPKALAAAGLPTDKMKNTYSPIVLTTGGKRVLFDTGNGEAAFGAEQGRARHAQRQSRGRRHRPQRHRRGGDLAFPRRPRERPADGRQQPGVSERRDHGARGGMEILDGRRRDEPRLQRPHDRAVRQQPPGVRRARPQGHALRLGQGDRPGRHRGRHARPQHRAHVVSWCRPAARRCTCSPTSATISRCSRRIRTGMASSTRIGAQAAATRRKVYDMLVAEKLPVQAYPLPVPGAGGRSKRPATAIAPCDHRRLAIAQLEWSAAQPRSRNSRSTGAAMARD